MRKRLIITFVLLTVGLSAIFFLPKTFGLQDSAVRTVLPKSLDEWQGREREAGKLEKQELDKATDFRKMWYFRESPHHPREADTVDMTMVLSGDDMNNSIHRPERCLLAQGYKKITPSEVKIDIGGGKSLTATRLHFVAQLKDGSEVPAIMYYWFVGADLITNSHYGRTLYDMQYRLVKGTNQRWAYISVQAPYGEVRSEGFAPNTEAQADASLQDVVKKTFFPIHKTDIIRGWKDVKKSDLAAK